MVQLSPHFAQKLQRFGDPKVGEPATKFNGGRFRAAAKVEKVVVAACEIFCLGFDGQIQIRLIFRIAGIGEVLCHQRIKMTEAGNGGDELVDHAFGERGETRANFRASQHIPNLCKNFLTQAKADMPAFSKFETAAGHAGSAGRCLEKNHAVENDGDGHVGQATPLAGDGW